MRTGDDPAGPDGPDDQDKEPWFFWPLVIGGTLASWLIESLLSSTPFYIPVVVLFYAVISAWFGVYWAGMGHSTAAAATWAVPLWIFWVLVFLIVRPSILSAGLFYLGYAFGLGMLFSDRMPAWWYRVILRSHPPTR